MRFGRAEKNAKLLGKLDVDEAEKERRDGEYLPWRSVLKDTKVDLQELTKKAEKCADTAAAEAVSMQRLMEVLAMNATSTPSRFALDEMPEEPGAAGIFKSADANRLFADAMYGSLVKYNAAATNFSATWGDMAANFTSDICGEMNAVHGKIGDIGAFSSTRGAPAVLSHSNRSVLTPSGSGVQSC